MFVFLWVIHLVYCYNILYSCWWYRQYVTMQVCIPYNIQASLTIILYSYQTSSFNVCLISYCNVLWYTYMSFLFRAAISFCLHVKRFIILHIIRFIWLHWSTWTYRIFCIIQDTYVCHSRCKVTMKFPKNNGFQILWQHVADSCSGCLGCICSKGAFLAVILHPKGKAMDSASISFREEQGLMLRKGLDFPNSFHSG